MALAKLSELLSSVKDNSYAIGSFNVSNMEMAMGAIKAAEKMQAPIIIQIAEGRLRYSPLEILGPIMMAAAKNTTVPIAVHLDHGGTMETIKLALELGFTSVMFDGSKYPLEENIARTKEVIALAKSYGADVEAEIGRVGGAEGDYKAVDIALTSVEEAKCFAEETKVDALAVAIGTAHGNYKETPKLRIDRLKEIAAEVSCPLVLHGGTGLTEQDFKNCIAGGIKKINIATASYDSVAKRFKEVAKVSAYAGVVTFVGSIAFTYWWGLNGAVFALFVSFLFQALLNARVIRKRVRCIKEEGCVSLKEARQMLAFSTPIALQESLYTVIHWLNMLVLIKFANYGEVGISSAASLWQSVVIFIPGVLKNVMFSHLVSTEDHKRMVNKLLLMHFVTTIIPVVGVLLFSGVITSFYGENFGGLRPVLIAQVCSAVFICLSEVYCYEFISTGRPWLVFGARMVRDLGIVLVGYLVVISVANQQALAMTFVSMGMNAVFLGVLYGLYGKKTKKEVSL